MTDSLALLSRSLSPMELTPPCAIHRGFVAVNTLPNLLPLALPADLASDRGCSFVSIHVMPP
jgi:hypothetical protein